jgi:hypothetical protein
MKPTTQTPPKRLYRSPKLVIYGDLIEMTRASGTGMAENAHGHGGNPKT